MRAKAAEYGRKGDKEAKRRGGQLGGAVTWVTRTPEEQEAIRERLRALGRGHQTNTSKAARAAQSARARKGMDYLSARKAEFLADIGVLKTMPITAPMDVAPPVPAPMALPPAPPDQPRRVYLSTDPKPERTDFREHHEWVAEYIEWVKVQEAAGLRNVIANPVE